MRRFILLLIVLLFFNASMTFAADLAVFPGAEGFGTTTPAGRGGVIYRVTNLNAAGPGSLQWALRDHRPRTILFEISGTIDISSLGPWGLMIKHPFITIAGQTAPSPGITVKGGPLIIETHDVLIQHLRVRPGDAKGAGCAIGPENCDAIAIVNLRNENDVYNVVIDHCSLSWSIDEVFSTWYDQVRDVTIRQCIISEPLHQSLHPKGAHGYGLIVGNNSKRVAVIGNLFAHCVQRNPLLKEGTESLVLNNFIYNFEIGTHGRAERLKTSIVGNYYQRGRNYPRGLPIHFFGIQATAQIYTADNLLDGNPYDPWQVSPLKDYPLIQRDSPPVSTSPLTVRSARDAKSWVLTQAGARPLRRGTVDKRIVAQVLAHSGNIINSQADLGERPPTLGIQRPLTLPAAPAEDDDDDGYTNLEEWLHNFSRGVENLSEY